MAITWQWKEQIGELDIMQGDKKFTLTVYTGNAMLILLHENEKSWTMYNFFADRTHFNNCKKDKEWNYAEYTGLTDKNGKKIFEGDIVLFEDESPSNYEYHDCTEMRCGVIEYGDNCFYITNRIAVEMEDLIYCGGKLDVEVIGNIFDNPEFLKGI